MARLFGDENFDVLAMDRLKDLGHDTLTVREAELASQRIPDEEVLAFATKHNRAVVTFDRRDYYRLHQTSPNHAGIIACTYDADSQSLAFHIDQKIRSENDDLKGKFLRIYRPNR